jgi:hypothetical protein
MDRNRKRIDYSYGSSRSFGATSLVDAGLGNGGGRYKAKLKHWEWD